MSEHDLPQRNFTLASGGWPLILAGLFGVFVLAMTLVPAITRQGTRPPGDGRDPQSYGFDLTNATIATQKIAPAQLHRDLSGKIVDPPWMRGSDMAALDAEIRGKYLTTHDRVIGVEIDGEARAYPLLQLTVHEVINDTLGGHPIAVIYNPLGDLALVVERKVDEITHTFGTSGLVYESMPLLYRAREPIGDSGSPPLASLWSPLLGGAVTGADAAAGEKFVIIPSELTHWGRWIEKYPSTSVLSLDRDRIDLYRNTNFSSYYQRGDILFPLSAPLDERLHPKARCLGVRRDGEWALYPFSTISANVPGDEGRWEVDGLTIFFARGPEIAFVDDPQVESIQSLWFAWHAHHPGAKLAIGAAAPEESGR